MDSDESCIPSLDDSDINDMMLFATESTDSSKKRKLRAEESYLFPLPKHFCHEQQPSIDGSSCPSSDINSAECYNAMMNSKIGYETFSSASVTEDDSLYVLKDTCYSTASSSSGSVASSVDQYCCQVNEITQEYAEDFDQMVFNCPEFAIEELLESQDSNPVGSYMISSATWSVSNQDTEEATTKPTIDQEFEQYFSALMM